MVQNSKQFLINFFFIFRFLLLSWHVWYILKKIINNTWFNSEKQKKSSMAKKNSFIGSTTGKFSIDLWSSETKMNQNLGFNTFLSFNRNRNLNLKILIRAAVSNIIIKGATNVATRALLSPLSRNLAMMMLLRHLKNQLCPQLTF